MRAGWLGIILTVAVAGAQEPAAGEPGGWRKAEDKQPGQYKVEPGTRIPLTLINSVSTKHASEGDRVYLETAFPVLVDGRIVVPPGSYVAGTITQVKKPGRVKGRGRPARRCGRGSRASRRWAGSGNRNADRVRPGPSPGRASSLG
jgi:hypothetical protein